MLGKFWTEERVRLLQDNYHKGTRYLVELFDNQVTASGILTFACRNGISTKRYSGNNRTLSNVRSKFNFRYFDQDPTPNMFFILGYIFADGNVSGSHLRFNCSAKDDDILLGIKKELDVQRELDYYDSESELGYVSNKVRLEVAHSCLAKILADRWQIFPGKGDLDCDFPVEYVDVFPGHYVRGFNAGDGSNGYSQGISFVGTFNYIDQLAEYLSERLGIKRPELQVSNKTYSVQWNIYEDRLSLYGLMFPEGDYIYSKRKKLEIEVGLGIYPEGIKRFQLMVTKSCKLLRRYLRECGCVVERADYRRNCLIFCTFSDSCVEQVEKFPTVRNIKNI